MSKMKRWIAVGLPVAGIFVLTMPAVAAPSEERQPEEKWPEPMAAHPTGQVLFDRLEFSHTDRDESSVAWDMLAWYGGDRNRLYLKSEGENRLDDGKPSDLHSLEVLGSRLVSPFWELQAGLGTAGSTAAGADRENYVVLSLFGTAPYRFEMDNALRINEDGDVSFSLEAEYDLRLTQISYLQPRLEVSGALTEAEDFDRPRGINQLRLGVRYRYELSREFAPYLGAYWSRSLGQKANWLRDAGEDVTETGVVVGVRFWL